MAIVTRENASRKARDFYEKGYAAMDRSNLDYAMDMFLQSLEFEPGFLEARRLLRAAGVRKFRDEKKGGLAHVMSSITGFPRVMMTKAKMGRKPLVALHDAETLLRTDPYNPMFVNLLCDAADTLNMPEVSVQSLEILREIRPEDTTLLARLAASYKDNKQMNEARMVYEKLHQMKPNDQDLLKQYKDATALSTMQQGGWGEATSYREMIRDSKEATSLEQEGKAVKSAKDVESLIQDTLQKLETEPGNINYKRALSDLYVRAGRLDDAYSVLNEAQEAVGGGDPQIDRDLANIHIKKINGAIDECVEAGDEAGAEEKRRELTTFRLDDARQLVQRYPNDLQFKFDLGVLLFEQGEYNDAIQQFQASQRNPKRRIQSLFYLGRSFKEKGQLDIASQQLTSASDEISIMDGTKKDILYELGQVHEAMGKTDEAVAYFKEIYAVDISYKDVAHKIEQGQ